MTTVNGKALWKVLREELTSSELSKAMLGDVKHVKYVKQRGAMLKEIVYSEEWQSMKKPRSELKKVYRNIPCR